MCMRKTNTIFLLSLMMVFSTALASKIRIYNINDIYGSSIRETFSICKDANGFIWTSSKTGVMRIAEKDFRIYNLPSKSTDFVSVKLASNNSILLSYTNNGQVFIYHKLQDKFKLLFDLRDVLEDNYLVIKQAVIDDDNCIWIATSMGLYKYDNEKLKLIKKTKYGIDLVTIYKKTNIFFTAFEGLYLLNTKSGNSRLICDNEKFPAQITSFYHDEKLSKIWLGTESNGLFCYDEDNHQIKHILSQKIPQQPILSIVKYDKELLVGIDGQGVWTIDEKGENIQSIYRENQNEAFSLRGDGVQDIFCDAKKIWIATYTDGLSFFEKENPSITQIQHQTNHINSLGNNHINKILEDKRGNIWFATHNGISRWNPTTNQWNNYYTDAKSHSKLFIALCEDTKGNIWAGSFSSGIFVLDGNSGKELKHYYSQLNIPSFKNDDVLDLFTDSDGDIWIGSNQELSCYITKENKFLNYPIRPVNSFAEFKPGKLLVSTSRGIILLNKKTGEIENLVMGSLTQDILIVQNDIWIATSGNGLLKYNINTKKIKQFTVESGLTSNYINSISYLDHYIWIGTEHGLSRINILNETINAYSSIYILSHTAFNVNASFVLRNGKIVMGTNNGALIFGRDMNYDAKAQGKIYFQDILISGQSIRENKELLNSLPVNLQKELRLKYKQNNVTLELVPVGTSIAGTKFSWKLEGVDKNWSKPSDIRLIAYQSLPNGEFDLKIKMYDSSLSQILDERSILMFISPPFWKTWWFTTLLIILLAGLSIYILRAYNAHLKQKYANEKLRFFTNTAHEIRTSLTLIKAPIEELNKSPELSDKSRYYLNIATENSSKLDSVANQLLDFQKLDAGKEVVQLSMQDFVLLVQQRINMFETSARRNNITIIFSSNRQSCIIALDKTKMEKVLDNLISNALKYSHSNSKIEIELSCDTNDLTLRVKDYGIGVPDKAKSKLFKEFYRGDNATNSKVVGSGIGLLLIKEYVEMHGGNVYFESEKDEGSTFWFIIPYQEVHDIVQSKEDEKRNESFCLPVIDKLMITAKTDNQKTKPHLLIVEDNDELSNFLLVSLSENYLVSVTEDGVKAWNFIKQNNPDLIISDIMMPNMDGFELCKLIKSTFETSHIPVILLTALSEKAEQLEGLGLGAEDYIVKPFDMAILQSRIYTIIQNREIVRNRSLRLILQPKDDVQVVNNELNDKFIKKAFSIVHQNLSNSHFNKELFASEMHVSPSLLYKKISALTGQSPSDYIKVIRMNYALNLLQSHKYTITEVSELSGFSSLSVFSRAFKSFFGKSPAEV